MSLFFRPVQMCLWLLFFFTFAVTLHLSSFLYFTHVFSLCPLFSATVEHRTCSGLFGVWQSLLWDHTRRPVNDNAFLTRFCGLAQSRFIETFRVHFLVHSTCYLALTGAHLKSPLSYFTKMFPLQHQAPAVKWLISYRSLFNLRVTPLWQAVKVLREMKCG